MIFNTKTSKKFNISFLILCIVSLPFNLEGSGVNLEGTSGLKTSEMSNKEKKEEKKEEKIETSEIIEVSSEIIKIEKDSEIDTTTTNKIKTKEEEEEEEVEEESQIHSGFFSDNCGIDIGGNSKHNDSVSSIVLTISKAIEKLPSTILLKLNTLREDLSKSNISEEIDEKENEGENGDKNVVVLNEKQKKKIKKIKHALIVLEDSNSGLSIKVEELSNRLKSFDSVSSSDFEDLVKDTQELISFIANSLYDIEDFKGTLAHLFKTWYESALHLYRAKSVHDASNSTLEDIQNMANEYLDSMLLTIKNIDTNINESTFSEKYYYKEYMRLCNTLIFSLEESINYLKNKSSIDSLSDFQNSLIDHLLQSASTFDKYITLFLEEPSVFFKNGIFKKENMYQAIAGIVQMVSNLDKEAYDLIIKEDSSKSTVPLIKEILDIFNKSVGHAKFVVNKLSSHFDVVNDTSDTNVNTSDTNVNTSNTNVVNSLKEKNKDFDLLVTTLQGKVSILNKFSNMKLSESAFKVVNDCFNQLKINLTTLVECYDELFKDEKIKLKTISDLDFGKYYNTLYGFGKKLLEINPNSNDRSLLSGLTNLDQFSDINKFDSDDSISLLNNLNNGNKNKQGPISLINSQSKHNRNNNFGHYNNFVLNNNNNNNNININDDIVNNSSGNSHGMKLNARLGFSHKFNYSDNDNNNRKSLRNRHKKHSYDYHKGFNLLFSMQSMQTEINKKIAGITMEKDKINVKKLRLGMEVNFIREKLLNLQNSNLILETSKNSMENLINTQKYRIRDLDNLIGTQKDKIKSLDDKYQKTLSYKTAGGLVFLASGLAVFGYYLFNQSLSSNAEEEEEE